MRAHTLMYLSVIYGDGQHNGVNCWINMGVDLLVAIGEKFLMHMTCIFLIGEKVT